MKVLFEILGEPKGKGRPKFTRAGNHVRTYTPPETASYENLVKLEYQSQCGTFRFGDNEYLDMRIYAFYGVPKSVSNKKRQLMLSEKIRPTKKPDMDNVVKIIADSLNGVAYKDDKQIVDTMVRKFYSDIPRVVIMIQSVTDTDSPSAERQ